MSTPTFATGGSGKITESTATAAVAAAYFSREVSAAHTHLALSVPIIYIHAAFRCERCDP